MKKFEFNDIEKQFANKIFDGVKKDMEEWCIENQYNATYTQYFNSLHERVKIGYYFIARWILNRF